MNLKEVSGDLFDFIYDGVVCHCIAADFGMSGGIAKQFVDKMNMKEKLMMKTQHDGIRQYNDPYGVYGVNRPQLLGKAVLIDGVFNLITKLRTYGKPTYEILYDSLEDMKNQMIRLNMKNLYMPKIGCGIDGLSWIAVSSIIEHVFNDTDINITVVTLE